jgi:hypothetical protein
MNTFVYYDIAFLNISYIEKCLKNCRDNRNIYFIFSNVFVLTSLLVLWSKFLTTNREVPGSIPGSTVGIFLEGEDCRSDRGLDRLVDFRLKAPPGTTSSSITTHTASGQRNCASRASQTQKTVTLLPCTGGRTTKSTKDRWGHSGGGNFFFENPHIMWKKFLAT